MIPDNEPESAKSTYELYIMRHGIAVARGTEDSSDDSKRPLTPQGKEKMRDIAKGLKRLGVELDWIVSSPLVRAVETAEIVATTLDPNTPIDRSEVLSPGGPPEALVSFLAKHPSRRRVLLTGHEPDLGELAARLVGAGLATPAPAVTQASLSKKEAAALSPLISSLRNLPASLSGGSRRGSCASWDRSHSTEDGRSKTRGHSASQQGRPFTTDGLQAHRPVGILKVSDRLSRPIKIHN